jgi:hypothetical protein
VGLASWRTFSGEIDQLVEIDPNNPSIPLNAKRHEPFFVTSGNISDPVIHAIQEKNLTWEKRGYGPLRWVQKHELVSRFREAHRKFFPDLPTDIKEFLELYTADGRKPLEKEKFARFVEGLVRVPDEAASNSDVRAATASAVLLTTYSLQNQVNERNHWAIFEAWVITGSSILALASKNHTSEEYWEYSFDLCHEQARSALEALSDECQQDQTPHLQGSPFSDGFVYSARITILCGLLSALRISLDATIKENADRIGFIDAFLLKYHGKLKLWGESGVPFYVMTALGLECRGLHSASETILVSLLNTICEVNGPKATGAGLPNPYWDAESCLRLAYELEPGNREEFTGFSYCLESLVHILARRGLKQTLRILWKKVTRIDFATVRFENPFEWLTWKARGGRPRYSARKSA